VFDTCTSHAGQMSSKEHHWWLFAIPW
jgi:hypothetical protein